jgi:hypothetical protein
MTFFPGAGKGPTPPPRSSGRPDAKSILPVGSRVLVVDVTSRARTVPLSDEPGHMRLGTVSIGAEVEVTAWRPRGGWGTRYRVRLEDGSEGWVEAGSLRPCVEPTPPQRVPTPSAKLAATSRPKKRGAKPKAS